MKIIVLLSATVFGFGLAVKDAASIRQPVASTATDKSEAVELEKPVMHVMLDTVEITAVAPGAIAAK